MQEPSSLLSGSLAEESAGGAGDCHHISGARGFWLRSLRDRGVRARIDSRRRECWRKIEAPPPPFELARLGQILSGIKGPQPSDLHQGNWGRELVASQEIFGFLEAPKFLCLPPQFRTHHREGGLAGSRGRAVGASGVRDLGRSRQRVQNLSIGVSRRRARGATGTEHRVLLPTTVVTAPDECAPAPRRLRAHRALRWTES
jgi:hypothetical protein